MAPPQLSSWYEQKSAPAWEEVQEFSGILWMMLLLPNVNNSHQNNLDGWLKGATGKARKYADSSSVFSESSCSRERHTSSPFMFSSSCRDTPTSQILTLSKSPLMTTLHDFMSPCSSFFSLWRYWNEKQSIPRNHGLTPPFCLYFAFIINAHLRKSKDKYESNTGAVLGFAFLKIILEVQISFPLEV